MLLDVLNMPRWRAGLALSAALAVFVPLVVLFRGRFVIPLIVAAVLWAVLTVMLAPRREKAEPDAPAPAEERPEAAAAMAHFAEAAATLRALARRVPDADRVLFEHLAELLRKLRAHHWVNPDHAKRTARFRRHVLDRIVEISAAYAGLLRRARPEQRDRLAEISRRLEGFVTVLEEIDRACVENDLTALEVNIEVLAEQTRRPF